MAACWLASLASAAAQSLPPDFAWQPVPSDLLQPVALAFAPDDDLYVATKPGRLLRLPASGEPAQTVLDLSAEVNAQGDRGLLGLALHPGFEPDGGERSWVYLLATLSPLVGSDPPPGFDGLASWSAPTSTGWRTSGTNTAWAIAAWRGNEFAWAALPDTGSV